MGNLTKEFVKYAKAEYDCVIKLKPSKNPDAFETLFSFALSKGRKAKEKKRHEK